ncbi:serine hydrolase domain-containing protein [Emcibacter sp.]|uniref:serine hydrolase domain-containing protein n=1 Tax=Emcibacter sp. TaxID=1979954 RepID=UPI003A8EDE4D
MKTSAEKITEKLAPVRETYAGKTFPDIQLKTFQNIEHLFPSRTISRGGDVRVLEHNPRDILDMEIISGGNSYDIYDYVSRNRLAGLLMLKDEKIAFEHYEFGVTDQTRWMSMSMAKSISATLVGVAIQDGYIKSVDDLLSDYIDGLRGTSYECVTIRQLLLMTSGVGWNEDHTDPSSERRQVLELQIAQKPGAILEFMGSLPRVAEPGERWNYSTGETHVVGELLYAATGKRLSDYLSEKIWSRLGMEADASWWLEAKDGLEVAGSGISATLRDYARFGLFIMNDGVIDGERVLPEGWVEEAGASRTVGGERLDYGYMWWHVPAPDWGDHAPGFAARGIFGQYLYINPSERVVLAVWSARAKPRYTEVILDNDFFNAAINALK